MRRIPVDISAVSFAVADQARAVTDFETKIPKANENGEPLYSVGVLATSPSEISIISVKVPGNPGQLSINDQVRLHGLVAVPWVTNGKNGVSFSAERIESLAKTRAVA